MSRFLAFAAALWMAIGASLAIAQTQTAVPAAQMPTTVVVPPATPPSPAPTAPTPTTLDDGYVIGIGDTLDVNMVGVDDFKGRVIVQQDGSIQLPYVGSLQARDKTLLQLGKEIADALDRGGYYVKPAIQVTVASITSRYVTVLGEVGSPGLVPVDRAYRASEMIARVGGLKPTGAETFYLRREGGAEIPLTLEQIARGGDDADPIVNPGDKIFVPEAPTFYIYGQVNAPGTFPIQNQMSMRMALARAGGMTQLGSEKRITVIRNGQELKKFSLSDMIQDDDVIVVGERFF